MMQAQALRTPREGGRLVRMCPIRHPRTHTGRLAHSHSYSYSYSYSTPILTKIPILIPLYFSFPSPFSFLFLFHSHSHRHSLSHRHPPLNFPFPLKSPFSFHLMRRPSVRKAIQGHRGDEWISPSNSSQRFIVRHNIMMYMQKRH